MTIEEIIEDHPHLIFPLRGAVIPLLFAFSFEP
jgi:hypothetical protein